MLNSNYVTKYTTYLFSNGVNNIVSSEAKEISPLDYLWNLTTSHKDKALTASWAVTPDSWAVTLDSWAVTPDSWAVTPDSWAVTPDSWAVTPDSWAVTPGPTNFTKQKDPKSRKENVSVHFPLPGRLHLRTFDHHLLLIFLLFLR